VDDTYTTCSYISHVNNIKYTYIGTECTKILVPDMAYILVTI